MQKALDLPKYYICRTAEYSTGLSVGYFLLQAPNLGLQRRKALKGAIPAAVKTHLEKK